MYPPLFQVKLPILKEIIVAGTEIQVKIGYGDYHNILDSNPPGHVMKFFTMVYPGNHYFVWNSVPGISPHPGSRYRPVKIRKTA
jgi:hypothetical protein